MKWKVDFRPEVRDDVADAARWYESREPGLGNDFIHELIRLWDSIAEHPFLSSRRHPHMEIRWRLPDRFPYRVIYLIDEINKNILVLAVLHCSRHESHWRRRMFGQSKESTIIQGDLTGSENF